MAPLAPWKDAPSHASVLAMFNTLHSSMNQQLIEKNLCNQSNHYENYGQFLLQIEAITCVLQNQHFLWWAKVNGTKRRALVRPWRVHFMNSSASKGASRDEATSNSKKIKPIALVVIELHLSEGIRQAIS